MIVGSSYAYEVHGLRVQSELPLDELTPMHVLSAPTGQEPAVAVRFDHRPFRDSTTGEGRFISVGRTLTYGQPGIATYTISEGATITVRVSDCADLRHVRFYLCTRALPALLYQRGAIPLHASALATGGNAVALLGESGAGKSSLVGALARRGARVLSDDVFVPQRSPAGDLVGCPGMPHLHLTDEAAAITGHQPPTRAARFGAKGKHFYGTPSVERHRRPLRGLYFLEWADDPRSRVEILPLNGFRAISLLRDHAYHHSLISDLGLERTFLEFAAALLASADCFIFKRPRCLDALNSQSERLIEHVVGLDRPPPRARAC